MAWRRGRKLGLPARGCAGDRDGAGCGPYSEFRGPVPDKGTRSRGSERISGVRRGESGQRVDRVLKAAADSTGMRLSGEGLAAERGGRTVFSGLGFAVAAGEMLAVTGPNGAGKSTLLRVVAGLLQPAAGAVRLEPEPEAGIPASVHYFGHLDALKPSLTVADNLGFWRTALRRRAATSKRRSTRSASPISIDLPAAAPVGRPEAARRARPPARRRNARSGSSTSRRRRSTRRPRRRLAG